VAVIDAVQSALRAALKIPESDRTLRLIEHPASHFAVPPGRARARKRVCARHKTFSS